MAKFYDESKALGAQVTSYIIKGNDLEIEIIHPGPNGSAAEFWSLRKAMGWPRYDNTPIKMICEVPVLEGLRVDGGRTVIFDVNSFDIQIANHQTTDAAALTVENGTLKILDSFNTTGAELAVGNNARMSIEKDGTLTVEDRMDMSVIDTLITAGLIKANTLSSVLSCPRGGYTRASSCSSALK